MWGEPNPTLLKWGSSLELLNEGNDICSYFLNFLKGGGNSAVLDAQ